MLGMAELVVVVLALAPGGVHWDLERFVTASGFSLWLALTASVLLCVSRHRLSRLPPPVGTLLGAARRCAIAALGASMAHVIDTSLGYGLVPRNVSMLRFVWGSAAVTMLIVAVVLRYLYVNDGWQRAGARQRTRRGRCPAGADQAAFPLQQHEHHRRPGAQRSGGGRARRAGPVGPVPRRAGRRRIGFDPARGSRAVRALPRHRAAAPGRSPAGASGARPNRCPGACRCRGWCCSRCWRTRCCTASRACPAAATIEIELAQAGDELAHLHPQSRASAARGRHPADPGNGKLPSGNRHAQFSIGQRLRYAYRSTRPDDRGVARGLLSSGLRLPVDLRSPGGPEARNKGR